MTRIEHATAFAGALEIVPDLDLKQRAQAIPATAREWKQVDRYIFSRVDNRPICGPIFEDAWLQFILAASPARILEIYGRLDELRAELMLARERAA